MINEREYGISTKLKTGVAAECNWPAPGDEEPTFEMPWLDKPKKDTPCIQ